MLIEAYKLTLADEAALFATMVQKKVRLLSGHSEKALALHSPWCMQRGEAGRKESVKMRKRTDEILSRKALYCSLIQAHLWVHFRAELENVKQFWIMLCHYLRAWTKCLLSLLTLPNTRKESLQTWFEIEADCWSLTGRECFSHLCFMVPGTRKRGKLYEQEE